MEIQQLKYFVQAARRGSFREAADDLFVSRAALSKSMGRLEGELGYELFERNRDGVDLTPAGKRFYAQVAPLVEDYDRINQAVRAQQGTLEIELAIPNSRPGRCGLLRYLLSACFTARRPWLMAWERV